MDHIGIFLSNEANKDFVIEGLVNNRLLYPDIDLEGLKGELYSLITIDRLIDEELRHDNFQIVTDENKSLLSMSSGQRRKALLTYLISLQPQYLVLDDIFGSVDFETREYISENLAKISSSTLLIQLFYRKQDVLSFIQHIYFVGDKNQITGLLPIRRFLAESENIHHLKPVLLPYLFKVEDTLTNPLVKLNNVSASYHNKRILRNISWTIQKGEFWQLKGPVGSGKSTLLSMIIGDNPKGYGQDMVLFGRRKGSGETMWDIKRNIGYFTPSMTLQFSHRDSVENMVISGLVDSIGLYTKPTDLQKKIANAWLEVFGEILRNKTFNLLSSGQQRMLLVIRAMIKHPPLLILDEPSVGLDDSNSQLFMGLINAIACQHKVSIIYVSHRDEPELQPDKILELIPSDEGSTANEK